MIAHAQSMPPHFWIATDQQLCQFVQAAAPANAPWRYAALAQLRHLEDSGRSRPGQGNLQIGEDTSSLVRQVLSHIHISELPTPDVSPISGGGVSVWWAAGNRDVQLSVFSDGEVVYLRSENGAFLEDPEGQQGEALYTSGLNWLLRKRA